MKKQLGLIGFPLSHSFSKKYFSEKFEREGLTHKWHYELFPIESIEKLPEILRGYPNLLGLNVTIPYKEAVLPFLDKLDPEAAAVGAVNCIRFENGSLHGFNTDVYGFEKSLLDLVTHEFPDFDGISTLKALVLGTGGAAKAVHFVLKKYGIQTLTVSRTRSATAVAYDDLTDDDVATHRLIINTTPLGMTPNTEGIPPLPYAGVSAQHYFYDLVYNPSVTTFMQQGAAQGARVKNGLDMLYFQAEKGWLIWSNFL